MRSVKLTSASFSVSDDWKQKTRQGQQMSWWTSVLGAGGTPLEVQQEGCGKNHSLPCQPSPKPNPPGWGSWLKVLQDLVAFCKTQQQLSGRRLGFRESLRELLATSNTQLCSYSSTNVVQIHRRGRVWWAATHDKRLAVLLVILRAEADELISWVGLDISNVSELQRGGLLLLGISQRCDSVKLLAPAETRKSWIPLGAPGQLLLNSEQQEQKD